MAKLKDSKAVQIIRDIQALLDELVGHFPADSLEKISLNRKLALRKKPSTDYSGASGGLRMLVEEEYFNEAKSLSEVISRLRQEGFNYPRHTISMALLRAARKRTLVRLPAEGGNGKEKWSYVVRK